MKLNFTWNDFESDVTKTYSRFAKENKFSDVTLISDDEESFSAHKLVLAGSSPFFRRIFEENAHPRPLLYLAGISSAILQYIMDFIYEGKVEIEQQELNDFLASAQKIRIEGLNKTSGVQNIDMAPASVRTEVTNFSDAPSTTDLFQIETLENVTVFNNDEPDVEVDNDTINEYKTLDDATQFENYQNQAHQEFTNDVKPPDIKNQNKIYCYEKIRLTDESQMKPKIEELSEKVDGLWRCKFCGKITGKGSSKKQALDCHIQSHFEGLSFPCQLCNKTFKSRNSQRTHKYRDHKDMIENRTLN